MPPLVLSLLIVVLSLLPPAGVADAAPTEAEEIFRKAVAAQGEFRGDALKDIHVRFRGRAKEQERATTVVREYWYRSADRSFRIRTAPQVRLQETSQRGVNGDRCWETDRRGKLFWLEAGNRDDRKVIRKIQERRDVLRRQQRDLASMLEELADAESKCREALAGLGS